MERRKIYESEKKKITENTNLKLQLQKRRLRRRRPMRR